MNVQTPSKAAASSPEPAARHEPADRARDADDFSRLLREKGGEADANDSGDPPPDGLVPPSLPSLLPPPAHASHAFHAMLAAPGSLNPPSPAASPGSAGEDRVDAIAALQSRMDLDATPGTGAPRAFDVQMNERAGVPLALRIVQPADAAGRWSLSISSAHMNPDALRRNTGRLDERLRSRALSSEPVRIEHDDDDS